jgi:cytochrome P450
MSAPQTIRDLPGPKGLPVVGVLPTLFADPLPRMSDLYTTYGPVVRLAPSTLLVIDPAITEHVLADRKRIYHRPAQMQRASLLIGQGVFLSEGEQWRVRRRLIQPAFHRGAIGDAIGVMASSSNSAADKMIAATAPVDIGQEMQALTMDILLKSIFSADFSPSELHEIGEAATQGLNLIGERLSSFFVAPDGFPTPRQRALRKARSVVDNHLSSLLKRRRTPGAVDREDLLAMLMAATDEQGKKLSDTELQDEIMTIFLAGHETTTRVLTWAWYWVSKEPAVRERLEQEVDSVLGGRLPTAEDIGRLTYTRQVADEALRLYPSVWIMPRQATAADTVGELSIPAGTTLLMVPYLLHRDPKVWPEPDRFNPDRFAPGAGKTRHPFSYVPFGGGQRRCLGASFATSELIIVLATIAQRMRFQMLTHEVKALASGTLRPDRPLMAEVEGRS